MSEQFPTIPNVAVGAKCDTPSFPDLDGRGYRLSVSADDTLERYDDFVDDHRVYPGAGTTAGLMYATLGLAGEAGETANKVKKVVRDNDGVLTSESKAAILDELGDTLWYVDACAAELGFTLRDVIEANVRKLEDRDKRGVIQGSGDNR